MKDDSVSTDAEAVVGLTAAAAVTFLLLPLLFRAGISFFLLLDVLPVELPTECKLEYRCLASGRIIAVDGREEVTNAHVVHREATDRASTDPKIEDDARRRRRSSAGVHR